MAVNSILCNFIIVSGQYYSPPFFLSESIMFTTDLLFINSDMPKKSSKNYGASMDSSRKSFWTKIPLIFGNCSEISTR